MQERQRLAEIEIARTIIECNLAFNGLQKEQWEKMVTAIANVGPCEGWTGVSYTAMRTRKIDEEKGELIEPLTRFEPHGRSMDVLFSQMDGVIKGSVALSTSLCLARLAHTSCVRLTPGEGGERLPGVSSTAILGKRS